MATVIQVPADDRANEIGKGLGALIAAILEDREKKREEEETRRKLERAQKVFASSATGQMIPVEALPKPTDGSPQPIVPQPPRPGDVLRAFLEAGARGSEALQAELMANRLRETVEQARAAAIGRRNIAQSIDTSTPEGKFIASVLQQNVSQGTRSALIGQTKTLFPPKKETAPKNPQKVTLFNKEGVERTVFVPAGQDPEQFIKKNRRELLDAGFSFKKFPLKKETQRQQTETERDVLSVARSMGLDVSKQGDLDIARSIVRNEDDVTRQLEKNFARVTESGFITFDTDRQRLLFNLSAQSVREAFVRAKGDQGKAFNEAMKLGLEKFRNLEFLPDRINPKKFRANDPGRPTALQVINHLTKNLGITDEDLLVEIFKIIGLTEKQARQVLTEAGIIVPRGG